jgi:hypothetical protein
MLPLLPLSSGHFVDSDLGDHSHPGTCIMTAGNSYTPATWRFEGTYPNLSATDLRQSIIFSSLRFLRRIPKDRFQLQKP